MEASYRFEVPNTNMPPWDWYVVPNTVSKVTCARICMEIQGCFYFSYVVLCLICNTEWFQLPPQLALLPVAHTATKVYAKKKKQLVFYNTLVTFGEAVTRCESIDADLAYVNTLEELEDFKISLANRRFFVHVWSGAHRSSLQWQWFGYGRIVPAFLWRPGYPKVDGNYGILCLHDIVDAFTIFNDASSPQNYILCIINR